MKRKAKPKLTSYHGLGELAQPEPQPLWPCLSYFVCLLPSYLQPGPCPPFVAFCDSYSFFRP